jgi:O-6-methylguanine DNA methyltransferase
MRSTAPTLAWDVPVRLLDRPAALPTATIRVDVGLPGSDPWRASTGEVAGRPVLLALGPVISSVSPGAADEPSVPLEDLLASLREGDGHVRVAVTGTPFTRTVLRALLTVVAGSTVTYGELAARAGRPTAVRAAAHVMATNALPLVLPCHRVVPASGGIGRYAHGPSLKAALLAVEHAISAEGMAA